MSAQRLTNGVMAFFAVLLLFSTPASANNQALAQDIHNAKARGALGETHEGYVAVVDEYKVSPKIKRQVRQINQIRRHKYSTAAVQQGVSIKHIQSYAATRTWQTLPPGFYFMDYKGNWHRKPYPHEIKNTQSRKQSAPQEKRPEHEVDDIVDEIERESTQQSGDAGE